MRAVFNSKINKVEIEYESVDEQAAILNFLSEYLTYSVPETENYYSNPHPKIFSNDYDITTASSLRGVLTSEKDSI